MTYSLKLNHRVWSCVFNFICDILSILILFLKLLCASHHPILVSDIGWRVNHMKYWQLLCPQNLVFFNFFQGLGLPPPPPIVCACEVSSAAREKWALSSWHWIQALYVINELPTTAAVVSDRMSGVLCTLCSKLFQYLQSRPVMWDTAYTEDKATVSSSRTRILDGHGNYLS